MPVILEEEGGKTISVPNEVLIVAALFLGVILTFIGYKFYSIQIEKSKKRKKDKKEKAKKQ